MTRLHQLAALSLVASLLALSPIVIANGSAQDVPVATKAAVAEPVKNDEPKAEDKAKQDAEEKKKVEAEEKKKKVAESLKKAMDPKKAAALAEKLEREKKEKKAGAEADADQAKKDAENAELKALLPQFTQQVRPLIRSRYNFLKAVAKPSKEQRAKIVVGAEGVQEKVVKTFAEAQLKMQRGMWNGDSRYPNGQQLVSESFNELAKQVLDPAQLERYTKEMSKKEEIFKSVCVKNLISMIDQQLVLSPDQREKLAENLDKKWDKKWVSSLEVFMYGDQFMPQLPDDVILPFLNASQKEVWKATPRNANNIWGGFGFMWGVGNDEGPLDKDFPKEEKPKEEATKKVEEQPKEAPAKKAEEQPKEEAAKKVEEQPKEAPAKKAEEKPKEEAPKAEAKAAVSLFH